MRAANRVPRFASRLRIAEWGLDEDGRLVMWDAATGKRIAEAGHESEVRSVAFSPDGKRIITGSNDRTSKVWDAETGKDTLTLKGHTSTVYSVAFSPDGKKILTGSYDKTAKVWDAETGKETLTLKGHTDGVTSVAFSPDGKRIITKYGDKTTKVWFSDFNAAPIPEEK